VKAHAPEAASHISTQLTYEVTAPSHFLMNIQAARTQGQRAMGECLCIEPAVETATFCDEASGNRFVRFDAEPGTLRIHYDVEVRRTPQERPDTLAEMPVNSLPNELLHYLTPSRYCESDLMGRAAQQLFGHLPPGIGRVQAICDWIYESIVYQIGTSDSTTTASEIFVQRAGVCRDFAHLGITLCRALNIPARLVSGYVWFDEPPQDFHAVFEAWLGGRWVLFDPTRMAPVDRLVRVGTGRDAKDVAFSTIYGSVTMTEMLIRLKEVQGGLQDGPSPHASGILSGIERPEPVVAAPALRRVV